MSAKLTPEPWFFEDGFVTGSGQYGPLQIAVVDGSDADGRVMGASRDLLAACEALLEWHHLNAMTDGTCADLSDLVIAARAAVAKAKGTP
jgi:hypothetical protein